MHRVSTVTLRMSWLACWLALLVASNGVAGSTQEPTPDPRQAWQLLDYIAADYRGAVVNGQVKNAAEFAELQNFAATAQSQIEALPERPGRGELLAKATDLERNISSRQTPERVATLAHELAANLLRIYPVPLAPKVAPDLQRGSALYASSCSGCHGARGAGDGPAASALDPTPIAFTDIDRARVRTPFGYYQVVTQGLGGTSMASFSSLSDADRWALAFFVSTLSFDEAERRAGEKRWLSDQTVHADVPNLEALSGTSEEQLTASVGNAAARSVLAYLRSYPSAVTDEDAPTGIALARARFAASARVYATGQLREAQRLALSAYLDGFEQIEPTLAVTNPDLLGRVESAVADFRTALGSGQSTADVADRATRIDTLLELADQELAGGGATAATAFLGSFTILLREGVEALLIVVAVIAFLGKAQRTDLLPYVHGGWLAALLAGAATWGVATYVVGISGAQRETTEGLSSVFAAAVLLSVGLWMHNKSLAGRWQQYLQARLSHALSQRSAWFLAGLSFIAVYREVFETILFYSALWTQGQHEALVLGLIAGMLLLAVIAYALLRATRRLPISQFFAVSSVFIGVLAVVLVGKGVAALQEAGMVDLTSIAGPRVTWLGVYPSLQTLIAQLLVAALTIVGFVANYSGARGAQSAMVRHEESPSK